MAEKPRFYDATVVKITSLTETVRHFVLRYAPDADTRFIAGQFMMVHLERDGKPHKKPYSIASSPSLPNAIELCIKKVEGGYVSTWFFGLKEGDVIHTRPDVRQDIADPLAALSTLLPCPGAVHDHARLALKQLDLLARIPRLACFPIEQGLVIVEIELRWRTMLEQIDHALRLRRMMRQPGQTRRCLRILPKQGVQRG